MIMRSVLMGVPGVMTDVAIPDGSDARITIESAVTICDDEGSNV